MLKYFKLSVWVRIAAGTRRSPQVQWCEGGWGKGFLTEKSQETGQTEKTQGLQCPETNNFLAVTSTRLKGRRCISYGHRSERKRGVGWLTGKMALGQEARPVRDNPWLHCSPFPVSSWCSHWPDSPVSQARNTLMWDAQVSFPGVMDQTCVPTPIHMWSPNSQCDGIWRWGFGEVSSIGWGWGQCPHYGINALKRGNTR